MMQNPERIQSYYSPYYEVFWSLGIYELAQLGLLKYRVLIVT